MSTNPLIPHPRAPMRRRTIRWPSGTSASTRIAKIFCCCRRSTAVSEEQAYDELPGSSDEGPDDQPSVKSEEEANDQPASKSDESEDDARSHEDSDITFFPDFDGAFVGSIPEPSMPLDVSSQAMRQPDIDGSPEVTRHGLPYPSYDKATPVINSLMDAHFPTDARVSEHIKWLSASDLNKHCLNAAKANAEANNKKSREKQRERDKGKGIAGLVGSGLEGGIAGLNVIPRPLVGQTNAPLLKKNEPPTSQQKGAKLNTTIPPWKPLHNAGQSTANGFSGPQVEPNAMQNRSGSDSVHNDKIEPTATTPLLQNNRSKQAERVGESAAGHDVGSNFTWTSSWTETWSEEEDLPEKYRIGPNLPPSTGSPSRSTEVTGSPAMQQPLTVFIMPMIEYNTPPEEIYHDQFIQPFKRECPLKDKRGKSLHHPLPQVPSGLRLVKDVPEEPAADKGLRSHPMTCRGRPFLEETLSCDRNELRVFAAHKSLLAVQAPNTQLQKAYQNGSIPTVSQRKRWVRDSAVASEGSQTKDAIHELFPARSAECAGENGTWLGPGLKREDSGYISDYEESTPQHVEYVGEPSSSRPRFQLESDESPDYDLEEQFLSEAAFWETLDREENESEFNTSKSGKSPQHQAREKDSLKHPVGVAEEDGSPAGEPPFTGILQTIEHAEASDTQDAPQLSDDVTTNGGNITTISVEVVECSSPEGSPVLPNGWNPFDPDLDLYEATPARRAGHNFIPSDDLDILSNRPGSPDDLSLSSDENLIPTWLFSSDSEGSVNSDRNPVLSRLSPDSERVDTSERTLDRLFREVADVYSGTSSSVNSDEQSHTPALSDYTGDTPVSATVAAEVKEDHGTSDLGDTSTLNTDPFTAYPGVLKMYANQEISLLEDYPALYADTIPLAALVSEVENNLSEYATPDNSPPVTEDFLGLYLTGDNREPNAIAHEEPTESRYEDGVADEEYHDALMVLQARIHGPDVSLDEQMFSQTRVPYEFDDEIVSEGESRWEKYIAEKPLAEFPDESCCVYSPDSEASKSDMPSLTSLESRGFSRTLSGSTICSESSSASVLDHWEYERLSSCQSPILHPSPIYGWMDDLGVAKGSKDAHIISPGFQKRGTSKAQWPTFDGTRSKLPEPVSPPITPPPANSTAFKPDPTSPPFIPTTPSPQLSDASQFLYEQWKAEHLKPQERKLQAFRERMKEVREEYEKFVTADCEDEMDGYWSDDESFYPEGAAGKRGSR
ncbi:hypothetical protein GLAREA_05971 [Glarea lozoyensis ATCC 20868]|uniref:Uncharacterized protein n=1 Tax=Glarea lozoyensis (strain ATCC 20868 / MF5171) TaxID=1116229 RepID=S3D731_GLAL2|nr:uncharacterized protein GLAREA_05971 [Glarea lozoyensis ATCC 20868]EPE32959.1 hypothetical protein GLAREA_05971 [Glarea lozoyensis ATCC 20868]